MIRQIPELNFHRCMFLGSGALYGCAKESSLKIEELTAGKVICKDDTFMGLRHGPEITIDQRTLVVYFLSADPVVRRYELDLMGDVHVKKLGMKRIAICDRSDDKIKKYVDYMIDINPDGVFYIPDLCRPIIDVTFAQILGMFKSLFLGLKPNNPGQK